MRGIYIYIYNVKDATDGGTLNSISYKISGQFIVSCINLCAWKKTSLQKRPRSKENKLKQKTINSNERFKLPCQ